LLSNFPSDTVMVWFFIEKHGEVEYTMYMGKNKDENEHLLKFGWLEDLWFHVDDFSSAHVYLRLPPGTKMSSLPEDVIKDCATFVKANSIDGSKERRVKVIYTMFTNLKKTQGMAAGQVGYHDEKAVYRVEVEKDNAIVNRIVKTKTEKDTDTFKAEREERDTKERTRLRKEKQQAEEARKKQVEQQKKDAELRSYSSVMTEENMTSNTGAGAKSAKQYEDDFM